MREQSLSTVTESAPTPTPWVIPVGPSNGFIICSGDDPTKPGDILFTLRLPFGRRSVITDLDLNANAAFIVKAVNAHEALVRALEKLRSYNVDIAAGRINYRPHDHIQVADEALSQVIALMAGRVRLTEAQKRILARMNGGDEVWTTGGGDPSAFWHRKLSARSPSFASLHVLRKTGLIANYDDGLSGKKYRITPAGRAILSEGKAS